MLCHSEAVLLLEVQIFLGRINDIHIAKGQSVFGSGFSRALSVFGSFSELHNAHQLTNATLLRSAL